MNLKPGYQAGCIGRVVEMHATYYARTAGFGAPFEAKVAAELAEFCVRYKPERDGLWLAHDDENLIHGSIVIDGSHYLESGAHLRWFITSDESRGKGVGALLLQAALNFCKAQAYDRVHLWTFEGLSAARHLYEKNGFRLASTQRGSQWGKEVSEQLFTLGDA